MKKLMFGMLFVALAFAVSAQTPTLAEGIRHMDNENYSAAQQSFAAIAQSDPKNAGIYYYIGEVSYRLENFEEAEKAWKKGLTINPQCPECKVGLGKLLLDQNKSTEAEAQFLSAERADKKNAELFSLIGEAYLFSKNPNAQKAVDWLIKARTINPKNGKYWAYLGDAYQMIGNSGEAMTSYETAVRYDPENTKAYLSMARIWVASRNADLAKQNLREAIRQSPDDAPPYKDLIEIYIQERAYDTATVLLKKYVTLAGTDVDARVRLVKFLTFQAKDYDNAILEGEKLLKSNPEQYTLNRWLAWAYYGKEDYANTFKYSQALFDAFKKDKSRTVFADDYYYYATAAFEMGKLDSAAHIYRKYIELDSSRAADIYDRLAKAYYQDKNYQQAIAYYNRKSAVKPLSNTDNYYLALSYYLTDENAKSDSIFSVILEIKPDFPTAWLYKARIANLADTTDPQQFLAKDAYDNFLQLAMTDKEKNKNNIMVAANYLAYYWVSLQGNNAAKAEYEAKLNTTFSRDGWEKFWRNNAKELYNLILELDPGNEVAQSAIKALNAQP